MEEQRHSLLLQNMPDAYARHRIILDEHGSPVDYVFLDVNPSFERMMGLTRSDIIGKKVTEVWPRIEYYSFEWIPLYGKVTLTGETVRFEQYSEPLGRYYEVIAYSEGNRRFSTIFRDITDSREKRLREEEAFQYKQMAQATIDALSANICVLDEQGKIIAANRSWFTFARANSGEMEKVGEGVNYLEICREAVGEEQTSAQKFAAGIIAVIRADQDYFEMEYPCDSPYEKRWFIGAVTPYYAASGKPRKVVITHTDITARKQMEMALLESEENMSITLDSIADAVIATDDKGAVSMMNPAAEKMCGWSITGARGKPLTDVFRIVNSETREPVANPVDKVLEKGAVVGLANHTALISWEGREYQIADSAAPIRNREGVINGVVMVFSDVSEEYALRKKLEENELRWRLALEGPGDGVWDWDVQTGETYFSRQWKEMLGYSEEEIGNTVQEWQGRIHPRDAERCYEELKKHFRGETSVYESEHRLLCKDGNYKWVLDRGKVVSWTHDGSPLRVIGTHRDITHHKAAEEELRRSRNLLYGVFESIQDGMSVHNSDLTIRYVNTTIKHWHQSDLPLEGKKCYQVYQSRSEPCYRCPSQRALKTGKMEREEVITPTDVGEKWMEIFSYPLHEPETNEITGAVEFVRDITERIQWREKLKESEEKYRALVEQSMEMLYFHDLSGNILDVNNAAVKETGYTKEELLRLNVFDLHEVDRTDQEDVKAQWRSWPVGYSTTLETKHQRKDGSVFPVEVTTGKIYFNNQEFMLAMARDLTERKQAEERILYMSLHDSLTGLYNRAYLEDKMQKLDLKRQQPVSVVMADLNGLKLVNDSYGHQLGNELLKKAAEIINNACREGDITARWGGDEFVMLLPGASEEEAKNICRRISNNCRGTFIEDIPVSLSLGISSTARDKKTLSELLKDAEDDMNKQKLSESRSTRSAVLNALLKTLEAKSYETEKHSRRMQEVAIKIGKQIGLPDSELSRLSLLITLHDIGKINMPEEMLIKRESLTEEEWELMKEHPEIGHRIASATEEFSHVAEDILSHHERWDGLGYPRGLKGEEIPLLARITAVADAYEVMSNGRPYKEPMSWEKIAEEFEKCAGTQFDPHLVDLFLSTLDEN